MDTVSAFHSTWFDAILLGVIAISVLVSFFRGFLREAISLCSWVLGIGLALKFSSAVAHSLFSWITSSVAAYIVAFIVIVVAVLLVGWLLTKVSKGIATITGIGILDRPLGLVFGFVRGVLVTTLMVMLVNVTSFAHSYWFVDSAMKTALNKPEQWIQHFIPDDVIDVSRWADHKERVLNGVASAHLMAKALNQKGEIGIVFHAADFFVTAQRYEGFKKTIVENYPDIKIVAEQGIGGPDFPGDAEKAASAMIVSNSNLDGIWAVWDQPAEGVMEAARANGKDDLIITTIDLGENVAIAIAKGGPVYGLGAQRPFDQGVTEAKLAGYGLLGKEAPPYVALPALPVEKDNILDAWKSVYYQDAPESIVKSLK